MCDLGALFYYTIKFLDAFNSKLPSTYGMAPIQLHHAGQKLTADFSRDCSYAQCVLARQYAHSELIQYVIEAVALE